MNTESQKQQPEQPDPAAVLGCALSLHRACIAATTANQHIVLSDSYCGMDEFMRQTMRVANLFETWACEHVAFDQTQDVWPYLMKDEFGSACLACMLPSALGYFDDSTCLNVAFHLKLPIHSSENLRVPIRVRASNPIVGSDFLEFQIQTMRDDLLQGRATIFAIDDDPFDEKYDPPYFALHGVSSDGSIEHIASRDTYSEILNLAHKLAPTVKFPLKPICFPN